MKRWQAVTVNVVLAGAMAATSKITDATFRGVAIAVLTAMGAGAGKSASESNPDGTPAQVAWEKR